MSEDKTHNETKEHLIEKLNTGWERLFPDNPELEEVFM